MNEDYMLEQAKRIGQLEASIIGALFWMQFNDNAKARAELENATAAIRVRDAEKAAEYASRNPARDVAP